MLGTRNTGQRNPAKTPKPQQSQIKAGTWVIAVLLLGPLAAAACLVARHFRQPGYVALRSEMQDPRPELWEYEREVDARITPRPIYPYSVIAGGVRSEAELRGAIARDSIVARHYTGFNLRGTRLVTLKTDLYAYVSYRVPRGIYWTTTRAHLKRGEKVVTDGVHMARGRCGNQVSLLPQFPVLARGPVPEMMEDPGDLIPPGPDPIAPVAPIFRPPVPTAKAPRPPRFIIVITGGGGGGGLPYGAPVPLDPGDPKDPGKPHRSVAADGHVPPGVELLLCALLALWLRRQRARSV